MEQEKEKFKFNFGNAFLILSAIGSIATVSFTAGTILEHQKMQDIMMERQINWTLGEVDGVRSDEERKENWRKEEVKLKDVIISLQDKVILLEAELNK